jgi:membrane protein YqaA with SNARE-associated domain
MRTNVCFVLTMILCLSVGSILGNILPWYLGYPAAFIVGCLIGKFGWKVAQKWEGHNA